MDESEQPSWSVYPQHWYDLGTDGNSEIWPPLDVEARQRDYLACGTRYTAVAVFLAHRWLMPHLLVVNYTGGDGRKHQGLFATRVSPTESLEDQLSLFLTTLYDGKADAHVGPLLCSLWVTASGNYTAPIPVLPLHCTRPRELVTFYQIQLGHTGSFKLPPDSTLKAIPLTDLQQPWMQHLPYVLSRFKFVFYDSDEAASRETV